MNNSRHCKPLQPSIKMLSIGLLLLSSYSLAQGQGGYSISKVLTAINTARSSPRFYYRDFINSEYEMLTSNGTAGTGTHSVWRLTFNEATPVVFDTARTFLGTQATVTNLTIDMGLSYAAYLQAQYLGTVVHGISHIGPGGSTIIQRISEYSKYTVWFPGENALRNDLLKKNETHMIADFIIDDGVSTRGHRANIYNSSFNKVGIGLYKSKTMNDSNTYLVLDFTEFTDYFSYECDKCSSITCQNQKDMGWDVYLKDLNLTDPCASTSSKKAGIVGILGMVIAIVIGTIF